MTIEHQIKQEIIRQYKSVRAFTIAAELPYSTVDSMLKKGVSGTGVQTVLKVCQLLNIDPESLQTSSLRFTTPTPRHTITSVSIPVLGCVPAGVPITAVQDILDYEEITPEMSSQGEFFALKISGDSMEPKFSSGDVVIVRCQSDVDSGSIAVVLIDGEDATVKKVLKKDTGIMLVPLNPSYDPVLYTRSEVLATPVLILGKVVELRAKFK